MRFSRKTRGRRQRGRETETDLDSKVLSDSFGAVGPKIQNIIKKIIKYSGGSEIISNDSMIPLSIQIFNCHFSTHMTHSPHLLSNSEVFLIYFIFK